MTLRQPSFSLGIEEEYLLIDRRTRDLVSEPPAALIEALETELGERFSREFLRTQVEVGTPVCASIAEARANLVHLRSTVAGLAAHHGLAPIACSTHPFARWRAQKRTAKVRYDRLSQKLQVVAQTPAHLRHARACRTRRQRPCALTF